MVKVRRWRAASLVKERLAAGVAAFLTTMLAFPLNAAIEIPPDPLITGSRVPPNVLFILDDSGSMAWRYMYSQSIRQISGEGFESGPTGNNAGTDNKYTSSSNLTAAAYDQNYITNTIYYNPSIDYKAWVQADGSRMGEGLAYKAAYSDAQQASGSVNLGSNSHYFYVPKGEPGEDLSLISSYYRYELQSDALGGKVIRSEWGRPVETRAEIARWNGLSGNGGMENVESFVVPPGASSIRVVSSGGTFGWNDGGNDGSGSGADLYVRRGSQPSTGQNNCARTGSGNAHVCEISNPQPGTWYLGLNAPTDYYLFFFPRQARYRSVQVAVELTGNSGCSGTSTRGWINCVERRPTGRTVEQERANFAAWYSYHRTRMKAAKAGAGEAFALQDGKIRVGFRSIWDRDNFDIPVNDGNDGLFVDNQPNVGGAAGRTTSRSTWYKRLYAANGSGGTPLRTALNSAGEYFSSTGSKGPYGPQSKQDQYTCRQNFAILTTDGYWNSGGADVGDVDGKEGSVIEGPNNQRYQYSPVGPYKDGYADTLADVAMQYWKNDLRPDMTNNVPFSSRNPAFWQHMVTFGISIGLTGTRGWASVDDVPQDANWPEPASDSPNNIDDLLHAAVNSRGAFVAASNPAEFARGLDSALREIGERQASFSNVAVSSVSLETGSRVFDASYKSGIWTGAVSARAVSRDGISGKLLWTSSLPAWDSRRIFTRSDSGLLVSFPTDNQIASLRRDGGVANYEIDGLKNANYIKGDRSLESLEPSKGGMRKRVDVLGDIVNSSPVYVADTDTLYVGANDGMLHAFDVTTGREVFAYVPKIIDFSNLGTLSRPDYAHRFFVDGPLIASPRSLTPGKTMLVGTLGRGGRGLYALDVTSPAEFGRTPAAGPSGGWERNATDGGHMGQILGRPVMAKVRGGRAAVIVGNGVNSRENRAALVVMDIDSGEVISEIDTRVGTADLPNGLSAPTGVYSGDGATLDYVYAGDMLGNVWKFDLTSSNSAEWKATLLFSAVDSEGKAQPITAAVAVATHPTTRARWIFVGTGRYLVLEDADPTRATTQSMYAFIDSGEKIARADLQPRKVELSGASLDGYSVRAFEKSAPLPSTKKGWFLDLPGDGERIVQDVQLVSSMLVTASMMPTGNACEADGSGFINALSAFTGTSAAGSYFDLDGDGSIDDSIVGSKRLPVGSVNVRTGMPTLPNLQRGQLVVGGSSGTLSPLGTVRPRWDRVSWREIRGD
ncbi:PilC/PilY family type IV pilus protein [Luteimonas sp. TWI662]|uniref:PilC/PilY family type IV pilus protein n=1 Tax=Luteimonas sp. TWI662 TaxID=3136789 RepID=UPI0032084E0F